MIQFFALVLVASVLATSPQLPPPPAATAIALTRADLPLGTSIAPHLSQYIAPHQLNENTVPNGLSVKGLRAAGFRGLYTQDLMQANDNQPYGYPWAYLDFPGAGQAHSVYKRWVAATKKPFNTPLGASHAADECRLFRSILSSHIIGLLCRTGHFVVFGHSTSRAGVAGLMGRVVQHAAHVRP